MADTITAPVITNLTRNGTTGSCDIAVDDETYTTRIYAIKQFGSAATLIGSLLGSGSKTLDFSAFTADITEAYSLYVPVSQVIFYTHNGATTDFSHPVFVKLCDGFIVSPVTISNYSRLPASCSFTVADIPDGSTASVLWNPGDGTLTNQVITNGVNTIEGLSPLIRYTFMAFSNSPLGDFGIPTGQFGDTIIASIITETSPVDPWTLLERNIPGGLRMDWTGALSSTEITVDASTPFALSRAIDISTLENLSALVFIPALFNEDAKVTLTIRMGNAMIGTDVDITQGYEDFALVLPGDATTYQRSGMNWYAESYDYLNAAHPATTIRKNQKLAGKYVQIIGNSDTALDAETIYYRFVGQYK